jgi:SPX domain protein involved in polyphosphate accumulation
MQKQRFELKYLIPEETARLVRDFVCSYIDFDEFSVGKADFSYPVHSLYLDSDDLKLYWETINGNKNRYKLRLRYYSTNPDAPVFFEIKRRINNTIQKQRGGVRPECVEMLLKGHLPQPEHLVSRGPNHLVALQNFCQLAQEIQAKPKVHIAYMREAYVSDDDQSRVTLDRKVYGDAHLDYSISTDLKDPRRSFNGEVILELKFTNRFPDWFRELVRVFGLMQCGAAKYCECVQAIGFRKLDAAA